MKITTELFMIVLSKLFDGCLTFRHKQPSDKEYILFTRTADLCNSPGKLAKNCRSYRK